MLAICLNDPPRVELSLWLGDTLPLPEWAFGTEADPADLTGSTFRLDVSWWATRLSLGSAPGGFSVLSGAGLDINGDTVRWTSWATDTASLRPGLRIRYALRRLIGASTETWAQGPITLSGFVVPSDG